VALGLLDSFRLTRALVSDRDSRIGAAILADFSAPSRPGAGW
jgi:hypothetical protein